MWKKFTSFCQVLKDAHKRNLVPFFCLAVYINSNLTKGTPTFSFSDRGLLQFLQIWLIPTSGFELRLLRHGLIFYPRDAMLARVLATALCLSVCLYVSGSVLLSQVGVLSKCMDGLMWFVDMEASFDQSYIVVIRKFRYLQNKGTSLWNFFLNSEL